MIRCGKGGEMIRVIWCIRITITWIVGGRVDNGNDTSECHS